jgi:hypothetical protein
LARVWAESPIHRSKFSSASRRSNQRASPTGFHSDSHLVEAIGQAASVLFSKTMGSGTRPGEFLVLGSIHEMRFLKPVVPGD